MSEQGALLSRVVRLLNEASIPHMVVGSLASSFHGEPRQTRDIDIVIDPTPDALHRFMQLLPPDDFYADADAATEALERRTSFNVVETDYRAPARRSALPKSGLQDAPPEEAPEELLTPRRASA